jgi:diguanylate cyclase (GGDEF)-like protein/PAS domain S-box-containing protein
MKLNDQRKSKAQLIHELSELRQQLAEFQGSHVTRARGQTDSEEALGYAESIIETLREPLLVLDVNMKILSANSSFYNTFEVTPTNTIGRLIYDLGNQQWDIPRLRILLEDILQNSTKFDGFEVVHEFESIGRKVMLLNARRIYRDEMGTETILLAIEDVTERKQIEEKLLAMSVTDELTDLTNRRGFFAMGDKLLKMARRQGKSVLMFYIDLDGLKTINDTLGHAEGDRALVDTANILDKTYRESDIVARIGGDEFVVIQLGTKANSTKIIRSRLKEAVKVFNSESNRKYKISLSVGVVYGKPEAAFSIGELLARGDKAMYKRKRASGYIRQTRTSH